LPKNVKVPGRELGVFRDKKIWVCALDMVYPEGQLVCVNTGDRLSREGFGFTLRAPCAPGGCSE